jgi:hypothetical protein
MGVLVVDRMGTDSEVIIPELYSLLSRNSNVLNNPIRCYHTDLVHPSKERTKDYIGPSGTYRQISQAVEDR